MVYDVIIVGGGPAGLTAGVYARTRKLSTLILEAQATGGQLEWLYPTKSVYDYPSYIAIEGGELAELFVLHSRESGAELRSEEVVDIQRAAGGLDRKSTRLNSSHSQISYAVFCLKKKKKPHRYTFSICTDIRILSDSTRNTSRYTCI